jgi:hypothetical protein
LLSVQVLAWSEDVDAAKWVQGEQVLVASEDEVGVAGDGECKELVVPRVAAGGDGGDAFDEGSGEAQALVKRSSLGSRDVLVKIGAEEDGFELLHGLCRH